MEKSSISMDSQTHKANDRMDISYRHLYIC